MWTLRPLEPDLDNASVGKWNLEHDQFGSCLLSHATFRNGKWLFNIQMRLKGRTCGITITDKRRQAGDKAILAIADEVDYFHIREKTKQTSEVFNW